MKKGVSSRPNFTRLLEASSGWAYIRTWASLKPVSTSFCVSSKSVSSLSYPPNTFCAPWRFLLITWQQHQGLARLIAEKPVSENVVCQWLSNRRRGSTSSVAVFLCSYAGKTTLYLISSVVDWSKYLWHIKTAACISDFKVRKLQKLKNGGDGYVLWKRNKTMRGTRWAYFLGRGPTNNCEPHHWMPKELVSSNLTSKAK